LLALAVQGHAGEAEDALLKKLSRLMPDTKVQSVRKLDGVELYEVVGQGNRIVYTDPDARIVINGDVYDLESRANLSEKRREELNIVDFSSLPLDKAMVRVKGNGSRRVAVFVDPDCPYCQQLEEELEKISDVTIYLFLYPIASLHPEAPRKARAVWCSADRVAAWDELMRSAKEPPLAPDQCQDPIADIEKVADKFNILGTPGLIFPNGRLVPGVIPAQEIEALLQSGSNS